MARRWVRYHREQTVEEDTRLETRRDDRIAEAVRELQATGLLPPRIRSAAPRPDVEAQAHEPQAVEEAPQSGAAEVPGEQVTAVEAPLRTTAGGSEGGSSGAPFLLWTAPGGDSTVLALPALAVLAGIVALVVGVDLGAARLAGAAIVIGLAFLLYLPERLLVTADKVVHLQGAGIVFARRELFRGGVERVLVLKRPLSRNWNWLVALEVAGRAWWVWINFSEQGALTQAAQIASALGVPVVQRDARPEERHRGRDARP